MQISRLMLGFAVLALASCDRTNDVGGGIATAAGGDGAIAACGPQKGHAYYPAAGLVSKGKDGWQADGIAEGSTTLTRDGSGELDILFKDARGQIFSSRDEGGKIVLLRQSDNEITVLVAYPQGAQAAEIYSFVRESDGKAKMLQLSSKGLSATMALPKAGVYVAPCTVFDLP